jgi:MOSC domain-containing protein YiiM
VSRKRKRKIKVNRKEPMTAEIIAVCTSPGKGGRKKDVGRGKLSENFGLEGDGHGGDWHRQVSLLAIESIEKMRAAGLDVGPGDFAENLTTRGIDLCSLPIGTVLQVGEAALLEITQIGKICHERCAIYYQAGDCVMPKEGIFAVVRQGGDIATGDAVKIVVRDQQGRAG